MAFGGEGAGDVRYNKNEYDIPVGWLTRRSTPSENCHPRAHNELKSSHLSVICPFLEERALLTS